MKPVDWIGGFAQFNYTTDKMNLYGMGGVSSTNTHIKIGLR